MAAWQFWTLIGVLAFVAWNNWAALNMLHNEAQLIRVKLTALENDSRTLIGIQAGMSNDVEAIKFRAQRD